MALASFEELRKIDVEKFTDKRDGMDYLNWAKCVDLLHENGAKEVWFRPIVDPNTHSSLFMADKVFTDKNGGINQCYEVEVEIHIDDLVFNFRHPLTNGSNPVKDNSLTQSRVWAAQTRAFVKGVAIRTGLGFGLWCKNEEKEIKAQNEVNLVDAQNPELLFQKFGEVVAQKMQTTGLTLDEIGARLGVDSGLDAVLQQKCNELAKMMKALEEIKKK